MALPTFIAGLLATLASAMPIISDGTDLTDCIIAEVRDSTTLWLGQKSWQSDLQKDAHATVKTVSANIDGHQYPGLIARAFGVAIDHLPASDNRTNTKGNFKITRNGDTVTIESTMTTIAVQQEYSAEGKEELKKTYLKLSPRSGKEVTLKDQCTTCKSRLITLLGEAGKTLTVECHDACTTTLSLTEFMQKLHSVEQS